MSLEIGVRGGRVEIKSLLLGSYPFARLMTKLRLWMLSIHSTRAGIAAVSPSFKMPLVSGGSQPGVSHVAPAGCEFTQRIISCVSIDLGNAHVPLCVSENW